MEYVSAPEARKLPGMRLVLSVGAPGPWGESAKSVFHFHEIPFTPVAQYPLEENRELVAWTGIRNAPVAIYDNREPVSSWLAHIMLAENLNQDASLLPEESVLRISCIGIVNELAGEWGFGWCRRLQMLRALWATSGYTDLDHLPKQLTEIQKQYRVYTGEIEKASGRIVTILEALATRLFDQRRKGSAYLVGNCLSAADIYWACFSAMLDPLPHELNPMPENLRNLYKETVPAISNDIRVPLLEHRDKIYREHLQLPVDF